jgi:hypothetical protein
MWCRCAVMRYLEVGREGTSCSSLKLKDVGLVNFVLQPG